MDCLSGVEAENFFRTIRLVRMPCIRCQPGLSPRQPVIKPLHDTKPNLEIVQGLAKRLKLSEYFDYTIDQFVEAQVKELPVDAPLQYLKKHGVYVPPDTPKYGATLKPEHRFVTQSGKIEIFSERLKTAGYGPLPVYTPPSQAPPHQFRLILGRKAFQTHANTTNYPWLKAFEPDNYLLMHASTARSLGIADRDRVEVTSLCGSIQLAARVSEEIRPDCVFMLHGYGKLSLWQRPTGSTSGCDARILEAAWDKISGNSAIHETFVKIRRV
jgi:thiosulfate reductase/polysulfide reductase chain A